MPEQLERAVSLSVESEVGTLRKVIVHRPGLEHTRLTPSNAEELLFDDVIWVKRAKEEHDAFCGVMRDRGVEVLYAEQLLTEVLGVPEARELDPRPRARRAPRRRLSSPAPDTNGARARHPRRWRTLSSAGSPGGDLTQGEGLTYESSDLTEMLLPPLPNFLFQRDPSCLDLRRRHPEPDGQARATPGDRLHGGDLPLAPAVRSGGRGPGVARRGRAGLGPCDRRGRRRDADRQWRGDDRHGRAHRATGCDDDRAGALPGGLGRSGARGDAPALESLHAPGHGHDDGRP